MVDFLKLSSLNESVQDPQINTLTQYVKVNTFIKKLRIVEKKHRM